MKDFYFELTKYINKCDKKGPMLVGSFKFNDSIIDYDVALTIWQTFNVKNTLNNMWEKEKDYNRLLRKENDELIEELSSIDYEGDEELEDEKKDKYVS